jgi:hypothetical protein
VMTMRWPENFRSRWGSRALCRWRRWSYDKASAVRRCDRCP